MWNRDDSDRSDDRQSSTTESSFGPSRETDRPVTPAGSSLPVESAKIGKSIRIRGEVFGDEDLTIEGEVRGKVDLKEHHLTIGPSGRIEAELHAKSVRVRGHVTGNIKALERVQLGQTSQVKGDVEAPRIAIADGARFCGQVDTSGGRSESARRPSASKVSLGERAANG